MKYIFCGNLFSNVEADMKKMKVAPPVSSHKYQANLIDGLKANGREVVVVNIPRVRFFPHYPEIFMGRRTFFHRGEASGIDIPFLNLPILNYWTQEIFLRRELRRIVKTNEKETYVLLSFNNYLPQNRAMISVKKKYKNVLLCNVIGDLHGDYGMKAEGRYDGIRGRLVARIEKKQDILSSQYDAFGFLTKDMAEALGVSQKPFVVIEGMYSGKQLSCTEAKSQYKTVFYAGAVEEEYGLAHLLRAFSMVKGTEYQLLIAGSGGAVKLVKQYAAQDARIQYLGVLTPKEVETYQQAATVLVNPRISGHTYVKYSFPSKNMECLASGKPYIAHDLICNPKEYQAYIQYPKDESDLALAEEIVRVCSLPLKVQKEIGEKAKNFIITEKNPKKQCWKIIHMMEKLEPMENT